MFFKVFKSMKEGNKGFDGKKVSHFSEILTPSSALNLSSAVLVSEDYPKGGCAFYVCLYRKASLTLASGTRKVNKKRFKSNRTPEALQSSSRFFFLLKEKLVLV